MLQHVGPRPATREQDCHTPPRTYSRTARSDFVVVRCAVRERGHQCCISSSSFKPDEDRRRCALGHVLVPLSTDWFLRRIAPAPALFTLPPGGHSPSNPAAATSQTHKGTAQ